MNACSLLFDCALCFGELVLCLSGNLGTMSQFSLSNLQSIFEYDSFPAKLAICAFMMSVVNFICTVLLRVIRFFCVG